MSFLFLSIFNIPHWKMAVHAHIALVVSLQTFATFALSDRESEVGANMARVDCLCETLFIFSVLFWDLQSLFHHPAAQSWIISILRLAKANTPDLKFQRIPVMEIYMKDFTAGSKLTCTDSLQLSSHLEMEKYQRSPRVFQNVTFLLRRGPSTQ